MSTTLETAIEAAWEDRANVSPDSSEVRAHVNAALAMLDSGEGRVAEPDGNGGWSVNQWLKKAVLLSFRLNENEVIDGGSAGAPGFDKVPSKFAGWGENEFKAAGFRVVPGAVARQGAYIGKDVVLMPSFVNIGAYVGDGTMVDTWAFLCLILLALLFRAKFPKKEQLAVFYFALFFSLSFYVFVGLIVDNLGAIVRYRTNALPFLLLIMLVIMDVEKIKAKVKRIFIR